MAALLSASFVIGKVYQNAALVCLSHNCTQIKTDRFLTESLKWQSNNQRALYWLANSMLSKGESVAALELFDNVPLQQFDAPILYTLIEAYEQQHDFEQSYKIYIRLATQISKPNLNWGSELLKAESAFKTEQWKIAKEQYKLTIALYPADLSAPLTLYQKLAFALQKEQEVNSTEGYQEIHSLFKAMQHCIQIDNLKCADVNAAQILTRKNSLSLLTKYQLAFTYFVRGKQSQSLQEWNDTITNYEQAISIEPNFVAAYEQLEHLYDQLADDAMARKTQADKLSLSPPIVSTVTQTDSWELIGIGNWDTNDISEGNLLTIDLYWSKRRVNDVFTKVVGSYELRNFVSNAGFEWGVTNPNSTLPLGFKPGTQQIQTTNMIMNENNDSHSLVLDNKNQTSSDMFSWPFAVKPNHFYLIAGQLHVDENKLGTAYLGMHWFGNTHKQPSIANWIMPGAKSQSWVTVVGVLRAPAQAVSGALWMMNISQLHGRAYFDNLVVAELIPPQ